MDCFVLVLQMHEILGVEILLSSEVDVSGLPDLKHLGAAVAPNVALHRRLQLLVTLHPK